MCATKYRVCDDSAEVGVKKMLSRLRKYLEEFDRRWAIFEKVYVFELMLIEKDAKRFVFKAIELEQQLKTQETLERLKGTIVIKNPCYERTRKKLVDIFCQINAVANSEGKGRDDLSADILSAAEEISRKISDNKSKAVRKLAAQVKESFNKLRGVFRKYAECVDAVDPQLKNNADLVEALVNFEKAWGKGKDFFTNKKIFDMLVSFSQLIEGLAEKHKEVQEKMESMDADIFLIIPCIAILSSLDDNDKSIYIFCGPEANACDETGVFGKIRKEYAKMKTSEDDTRIYNIIEQAILEKEIDGKMLGEVGVARAEIAALVNEIKRAAIVLQRSRPADWNFFMETAMGII